MNPWSVTLFVLFLVAVFVPRRPRWHNWDRPVVPVEPESPADVPQMAERPADPRPGWRKPVQILPGDVADSIHQAARRITVEANRQRLADLQKDQAAWPSSQADPSLECTS